MMIFETSDKLNILNVYQNVMIGKNYLVLKAKTTYDQRVKGCFFCEPPAGL